VIAWDSGNPRQAIDQLRSLGAAVWTVEIRELAEIAEVIESMGKLAGEQTAANAAALNFRQRLELLSRRYDARPQLEYFYQVASRPLFTLNGDHLISKGLSLCGGRNIFEQQPGLAFQVSFESVIANDPDALFAPGIENEDDPLASWLEWPRMQAVQNSALFLLPADEISRASPRILDALELACSLLDDLRKRIHNE
jgi:iron complex transport system substrate-binding protein